MKTTEEIIKLIKETENEFELIIILATEIKKRDNKIKQLQQTIESLDKAAWKPGDH